METIKTWGDRAEEKFHADYSLYEKKKIETVMDCMRAEIADLRAALVKQAEAAPVGATIERGLAQKDANLFGTGFLVHGKRVAPEWVQIVLPDRAQRAGSGEVAPVAWRYQPKDGLPYPAYTEREAQALAYDPNPIPLYTAPPLQPDSGRDAALLQNAELVHERLKDIRHLGPGTHASDLAKEALPCIRAIIAAMAAQDEKQ